MDVQTGELAKEVSLSLAKALQALEKQLPKGKRVSLRIDAEAFGKDLSKVAQTPVELPVFPTRMSLGTALRLLLGKVHHVTPVAVRIGPDYIAITTLRTRVYDVRDILQDAPRFFARRQGLIGPGAAWDVDLQDLGPQDGAALLTRLILTTAEPDFWGQEGQVGAVRILNGSKLEVVSDHLGHKAITNLLMALRRAADVAVIMNARVYEVDQAFFTRQIAPLLKDAEQPLGRRFASLVPVKLYEQLKRQKVVAQGGPIKIRPGQQADFLSWQSAFRYIAHPGDPEKDPGRVYGTALQGVTFLVRPDVSPDRRSIDLKVTQAVKQLKWLAGKRIYVPSSDVTARVERPVWRDTMVATTIHVMDGQPFLMPMNYGPTTAAGKEPVWVLMAEPRIWIEEEEEAIRRGEPELPPPPPQKEAGKEKSSK